MAQLVRISNPDVTIFGTTESMLVAYPVAPTRSDDGGWTWDYTGASAKDYDETAVQRLDPKTREPLFQDEHGDNVPLSDVGVCLGDGQVVPLRRPRQ